MMGRNTGRAWLVYLVLIAVCLLVPAGEAMADTPVLRVLTYHRFDTGSWISTPMNKFRKQMNYLQDHDYTFLTIEQVIHHLKAKRPFPKKSVLIMVDDGYRSVDYNAFPFLKQNNIPVVLSIYPRAQQKRYNAYIDWDTVALMANEPLIHIGNHSYSHSAMRMRKGDTETLDREVRHSQKLIAKHTGIPPRVFVLPYGVYDSEAVDYIEKHGPSLIFSSLPGVIDHRRSRVPYKRFMIDRSITMERFKSILRRQRLNIRDISLQSNDKSAARPDTFSFQLRQPGRIDINNTHVFLNGTNLTRYMKSLGKGRFQVGLPESAFGDWNQLRIIGLDKTERIYRVNSVGFAGDQWHDPNQPEKEETREGKDNRLSVPDSTPINSPDTNVTEASE